MPDVGWYHDDRFLDHDTGPGHPERPDRLRAIADVLSDTGLAGKVCRPAFTTATPDAARLVHDPHYVDHVRDAWGNGIHLLDGDTPIGERSYAIALLALGAAIAAVDAVMSGDLHRAFVTARPPGHHAERDRAMGFCLFNNIAVAAQHAIARHNLDRIAIVDFDVHHGNGTQHIFEERADVLFISIHQDPRTLYPGTGYTHERGRGPGEGFTLNVPMPPGSGDDEYLTAFDDLIVPRLDEYSPQLLLISAGFDASKEDPLAQQQVTDDGFFAMTQRVVRVADRHGEGRIVSVLEGGYDLGALGRGAAAHTRALLSMAT